MSVLGNFKGLLHVIVMLRCSKSHILPRIRLNGILELGPNKSDGSGIHKLRSEKGDNRVILKNTPRIPIRIPIRNVPSWLCLTTFKINSTCPFSR